MITVPEGHAAPIQQGDSIVVDSCWNVAVLDLGSSFYREGVWEALWKRVRREDLGHFGFMDLVARHARRGRLFHFITLLGGVFHARIRVFDRPEDFLPNPEGLGMPSEGFVELRCPTGRIAISDLVALGSKALRPTLVLEPGVYRLAFQQNHEAADAFEREETWRPSEGADPEWVFDMIQTAPSRGQGSRADRSPP